MNNKDYKNLKSDTTNNSDFSEVQQKERNLKTENLWSIPDNSNLCFGLRKNLTNGEEFYSPSVKAILEFSKEELGNMPGGILSIIHEDDIETIKRKQLEFESDEPGSAFEIEYRIISKSSKIIWLKQTSHLLKNGNDLLAESVIFNITQYKAISDEINNKARNFEEINTAKDKFISIISHDLRAPFTSLLGFSEILLNETELPNDEKREYLKYIHDASSSQLNLINYLLDWSRLQTGRMNIVKKRVNVKNLVSHAKSNLTGMALRKNIEIKINVDPSLYVDVDERLLIQAVSNLLSNAVKFTPENKRVVISASKFKEGLIEIVVKDEGVGIPEKNQDKLFKLDEKFSMTGTNGEKGTGFGLTLVKEIIEKHGGDIWFYSKVDEGTEFHFTLHEAKNLVLLVEDDKLIRSLYIRIVKNELDNFDVLEADNGYEALSMLIEQTPSLIIVDHEMPLMNGNQLVEAMREKQGQKDIPVIIVSGELTDEIIAVYHSLGVNTIISKPFDYSKLVELVKGILEV